MMNMEKAEIPDEIDLSTLTAADKWILSKVNSLAKEITANMDNFDLGIAVQKIYDFIWEEFCDWYIELSLIHISFFTIQRCPWKQERR